MTIAVSASPSAADPPAGAVDCRVTAARFYARPSGLPLQNLWQTLTDPASADPGTRAIVWDIRLPYAVMAIIVGLALDWPAPKCRPSSITRWPARLPRRLLGCGVWRRAGDCAGIGLPGIPGQWFISANAFIFALLAALLLDGITRWTQVATSGVILFGIALVFTSQRSGLDAAVHRQRRHAAGAGVLDHGSIDRASWSKVAILLVALALVMPLSLRSAWKLTALRLGEDRAISLALTFAVCA